MDGNSSIHRQIALLAGGDSSERTISLASGEQVAAALKEAGYFPIAIDPSCREIEAINWSEFHACFIALHGGAGEDGRIQAQLDSLGVSYTGSGAAASQLAMDKAAAKDCFLRSGVPTLPFVVLDANKFAATGFADELAAPLDALGYPLVVKPSSQGSSVGIGMARSESELRRCLLAAAKFDDRILIEPFVVGREFTVALLGRDPLPIIEVVAPQQFFSYEAKYVNPTTEFRIETGLPAPIEAQIYRIAMDAAEALSTAGLVRVDLMLDEQKRPWVLEVNTIPGLTARSLAPRAAQAAGIELPALVDWMVRDAVDRKRSDHIPLRQRHRHLRADPATSNLQGMHY